MNRSRRYIDPGMIIALVLVIVGVLLILNRLNIHLHFDAWRFWPVILIIIGLSQILQPREGRHLLTGLFITGTGVLFLAINLGWISQVYPEGHRWDFEDVWPFFLVFIGLVLLEKYLYTSRHTPADKDYIRHTAILGGGNYHYNSKSLSGGSVTAIMGGCSLDLRQADMDGDSMVIDTFAFWGGIEIKVPANWIVQVRGTPIMGAMENKIGYASSSNANGAAQLPKAKQLIVRGMVIMGGVEVKR